MILEMPVGLSVVIPTYNGDRPLRWALEGYCLQTVKDFEVIVVNDGGGRETEQLVNSFQDRLDLSYYYLEPPSAQYRLAAARNLGIRHSRAQRVVTADQDCVPATTFVAIHQEYKDQLSIVMPNRLAIAQSRWEKAQTLGDFLLYAERPRIDLKFLMSPKNTPEVHFIKRTPKLERYSFEDAWSACTSYPAALVKEIGGFWEEFVGWGGEDGELARRLVDLGCKVILRPDLCIYHLDHPTRMDPAWRERAGALFKRSAAMDGPVRNGGPL